MTDDGEAAGFTLDQALRARSALRREAGMGEERFPLAGLVEMIGDEIEALRRAGRDDAEIARLAGEAAGAEIDPGAMAEAMPRPSAGATEG